MDREDKATGSSSSEAGDSTSPVVDSRPADDTPEVEVIERDSSTRALLAEILPEVALLIGAVYFFYQAGRFSGGQTEPGQLGPGFWPRMAATGLAIALVVRIFQAVRARNRPIVKIRDSEFPEEDEPEFDWTRVGIAMGLAIGYVLGTMFIGYLFATAAFLTAFIWIGGQRRWYAPLIAIAGALISAYVFIGVVYVALPTGVGLFDTVTVGIYELLGIQ